VATAKVIDLFGMIDGIDFHISLEPAEGENALDLLIRSTAYLKSKGAGPRPQKGFGGGGGKKSEPVPTNCPVCEATLTSKDWTNKEGRAMKIWKCPKNEEHIKRFVFQSPSTGR